MKATLTSYSHSIGYDVYSYSGQSISATFVAFLPSKFNSSEVEINFTNLDIGVLGNLDLSRDDEWDIEIKLTHKPKPKLETILLK